MVSLTSPLLWPLTLCRRSWPSVHDLVECECILSFMSTSSLPLAGRHSNDLCSHKKNNIVNALLFKVNLITEIYHCIVYLLLYKSVAVVLYCVSKQELPLLKPLTSFPSSYSSFCPVISCYPVVWSHT